jgi:ATP-dependent RNA helicase DDX19/DBP5
LDLSKLKIVVFDEADELLLQEANEKVFLQLKKEYKTLSINPQQVLFSATFDDSTKEKALFIIQEFEAYFLPKEALKLKGV